MIISKQISVILHPLRKQLSPDGGIGRRARLKIWFRQRSAGSIPVLGTTPPFLGGFLFYLVVITEKANDRNPV